jgi:dipeptidyl aminopeptidase/acylaminoacyl peptidase
MNKKTIFSISVISILFLLFPLFQQGADIQTVFSPKDELNTKRCGETTVSPNGQWIAYSVSVNREAGDEPGPVYRELYLISTQTREIKPFITGETNIFSLRWNSDSTCLAFLMKRGKDKDARTQVWKIAVDGGEAVQLTNNETGVDHFEWHPTENKIAFTAETPESEKEKKLKEKGYDFIFYEENLKHENLYLFDLENKNPKTNTIQLTKDKQVWNFTFSPDGKTIAAAISPQNLIDQSYMFKKLYLLDITSKELTLLPGMEENKKLGNYIFSPDGSKLAFAAASEQKDHAVSQAYILDMKTKKLNNLTIPDFHGHVENIAGWKNNKTVMYISNEGVWPTLSEVPADGGNRKILLHSKDTGLTFRHISFSKDFKHAAFAGSSPAIPDDLFYWNAGKKPERLTTLNPWLADRKLGEQKIIHYNSRDGWEIEGLLVYPVDYKKGEQYPLIVVVHGGPEGCYSNDWLSNYSSPAQVWAGKGYVVFFPNYRASTGYGVKFGLVGYHDAAGKEFDDIADGIDYLINEGIADKERVGLGGGSYGGYAAAWFSSYYTKYVRAVCMFVGISDLISKRGTTDIPYEELYVHSGEPLEKMWEDSLKRSPIYWAHQSKTATLILGGADDPRVHPSQSMEFYRRLKMNNHPAVRLVQYPGEGHGNRKQPGRIDVLYRTIQWYDWYVKDKKPMDPNQLPPLDISENYGLEL